MDIISKTPDNCTAIAEHVFVIRLTSKELEQLMMLPSFTSIPVKPNDGNEVARSGVHELNVGDVISPNRLLDLRQRIVAILNAEDYLKHRAMKIERSLNEFIEAVRNANA